MAANTPNLQEVTARLSTELAAQGKLLESGWVALRALWLPPDAPSKQVEMLREAFYAGAQHLFGSLHVIFDAPDDPTDADLDKLEKIAKELDVFIKEFELRHQCAVGHG